VSEATKEEPTFAGSAQAMVLPTKKPLVAGCEQETCGKSCRQADESKRNAGARGFGVEVSEEEEPVPRLWPGPFNFVVCSTPMGVR
jgi:hypothetical protein